MVTYLFMLKQLKNVFLILEIRKNFLKFGRYFLAEKFLRRIYEGIEN